MASNEENNSFNNEKNRKTAQRLILIEHVFNTLADRMWLYAAGLLLMDAVLKLNDEASPITVSSMYGLVLNVVKVLLVGTIGGVVERMPRLSGALVPLVIQNSSVIISAIFLGLVFGSSEALIPAWGLFTIVTVFSSIAVLASVALMNVVSRDWAVEIATDDELTILNSWLRAIDQGSLILASGLAGIAISYDKMIGCAVIGGINVVAMIIQGILLTKVYKMMPNLAKSKVIKTENESYTKSYKESLNDKMKYFYESWYLFIKSIVFLPGVVLGVLYLNILGMGFPLQGFGRQSCLTEATISIIYIIGAVTGFVAPVMFPTLVRNLGLPKTGIAAGVWQIIAITISIIGLFVKDSTYNAFDQDAECPVSFDNSTIIQQEDTFWISCPKDGNNVDIYQRPETFISVGLIFLSSILQRWGVYLFDMAVTQLFQITVDNNERNRVAAGQFSLNSMFSIAMYFFGLVWTETCNFGSAILVGSALIVLAYFIYIIWALRNNAMIEGMNRTEEFDSEASSNHSKTSKFDVPYETEEDEISEL